MGYSAPEDKIFNNDGKPLIVPTVKNYPPDTTAVIFWLKNRRPDEWRDKIDHGISAPDGGPVKTDSKVQIEFIGMDGDEN
jgi:hypothetical protein